MTEDQEKIISKIASSWGSRFRRFSDDIRNEAFLACLEVEIRQPKHPNMTALMRVAATGRIKNLLATEQAQSDTITCLLSGAKLTTTSLPIDAILDEYDFTDFELFVIEQRIKGYTLLEIAGQSGFSRSKICNTMTSIKGKILQ